jgi:hypothetical protein
MRINVKGMVDNLISRSDINRTRNDYSAALGNRAPWAPPGPPHIVANQVKMDVREARKLTAAIEALPKVVQGSVVKEIAKRATLNQLEMPRFGGLKLSEAAAKELDRLAQKLGVDVDFKHGQPFPIHPVG